MGESQSTCQTPNDYSNWNFPAPTDGRKCSFATRHFAEGASRRTYRAIHWKPDNKYRQKAVVKEYKDSYAWAQSDWDTAVETYEKTKELAKKFNEDCQSNYPIHIVYYDIQRVICQPIQNGTPKLNEYVIVEDYLEGEFQKFISNTGWVNPECLSIYKLMPTFAHWTWVHTNGNLMVVDLQGVRYTDKYILTDPCILSLNKEYGATDTAVMGMALFFITHKCTDLCHSFNISHRRPDVTKVALYLEQLQISLEVQIPTSYLSEEDYEKIPSHIKVEATSAMISCWVYK